MPTDRPPPNAPEKPPALPVDSSPDVKDVAVVPVNVVPVKPPVAAVVDEEKPCATPSPCDVENDPPNEPVPTKPTPEKAGVVVGVLSFPLLASAIAGIASARTEAKISLRIVIYSFFKCVCLVTAIDGSYSPRYTRKNCCAGREGGTKPPLLPPASITALVGGAVICDLYLGVRFAVNISMALAICFSLNVASSFNAWICRAFDR